MTGAWVFVFIAAGLAGPSQFVIQDGLSEAQCKEMAKQVLKASSSFATGCFGPGGEFFDGEDL